MRSVLVSLFSISLLLAGCRGGGAGNTPPADLITDHSKTYTEQKRDEKAAIDQQVQQLDNELGISTAHFKDFGQVPITNNVFGFNYADEPGWHPLGEAKLTAVYVPTEDAVAYVVQYFADMGALKLSGEYTKLDWRERIYNKFTHAIDLMNLSFDVAYEMAYKQMKTMGDNIQEAAANSEYYKMLNEFFLMNWHISCVYWGDRSPECFDQDSAKAHAANYVLLKAKIDDRVKKLKELGQKQFSLHLDSSYVEQEKAAQ